ncbi:sensor histidine kinase [Streptomyces sp. TLI_105]|uniref:sensor histidine kinase n=1 Tax=Streptomyces sp. TLI_105 TaxID=1881019 RepID=UPI00089A7731|nr:sensor histidine kinase [Streptomyces sp. TLI_105]SEE11621.1 Signal transduction histidine kinase [Streptomyces sp. TLI_105]
MRTPRKTKDAEAATPPPAAARGRRAHAGPPADEPGDRTPGTPPTAGHAGTATPGAAGGGAGATAQPSGPISGRPYARSGAPAGPPPPDEHRVRPAFHGLRPRSVRAKIVSLLMVPVVSLFALWGFATVTTAQDVAGLRRLQRVDAEIREPVTAALTALQAERRAAVRQVAAPGTARAAELKDRIRRTDEAVARLRLDGSHTVGDTGDLPGDVAVRVSAFVGKVEGLARLRTAAADGRADWDQVYEEYTDAVSAAFAVDGALTGIQDAEQGADARVLLEFGRAGEMLSREDALLTSAHLTGRLSADRLRDFSGAVETRRALTDSATPDLPAAARTAWARLSAGGDHARLTRAEDRVSAADPGRPAAQAVTSTEWDDALAAVHGGLAAIETDARRAAADRSDPFAGVLTASGAAVVLGLAAVAASLVISVRIGRGLVVELVSLRNTALGIARRKLPAAMRRLRAGEEIDVQAEAPPGPVSQDEIGQVGEALTTVHRAALSAAVERAELASGISGVFVNLARRSQVLVHRQLNLLDSMERRADDPNELGDLFRLDHLTTRMRRHAESLIILSGAAPGRAWRMPVPLTNVVRAAVSEIEDYARVEVRRLPETAVVGGAVADLTHLLAELIENAAQFSPPHTKVRVSGEPVGNGYALEIEDRGLGMGKETLAEANARIAQSEALDLFDSDRLGLFVVSRLSSRHDIKVHLRTSPYGGTTAVVLLPTDLLQGALPPGRGTPAADSDTPHDGTPRAGSPRTHTSGGPGADAARSGVRPEGAPYDDNERAAREREEARRAEARRFGRPQIAQPAPPAAPTNPALPGNPASPAASGRRAAPQPQTGTRPASLSQQPDGSRRAGPPQSPPASRPQPPARPTAVPAPAPAPALSSAPAPASAAVTELRRRDSSVPTPPAEQPPAAPADRADAGSELPRRVRQASLVPQLREAPAPTPVSAPVAPGTDTRTPEQVRDRMAAYRDGWQRGGGAAPGARRPLGTGFGTDTGHGLGHGTAPLDPRSEGDDA